MQGGFYQQKSLNPKAITVVVLLHGAALGALVMSKPDIVDRIKYGGTKLIDIKVPPPPEPEPKTRIEQKKTAAQTFIDLPRPLIPLPLPNPPVAKGPPDPIPLPPLPPGPEFALKTTPPPPIPMREPVRTEPRIDTGSALQPPYPASAQREGAEGSVQVRVEIGPDGRVKAVAKVKASRDDFFAATERQALRYWRFKPATVDGKPIQSSKVMTVHFRIDDLG